MVPKTRIRTRHTLGLMLAAVAAAALVACDHEVDADDAVRGATRGPRAVYWVSPTAMDRDPLDAHAAVARHIRTAVEANGIVRVVFQSSVGAEKRHGVGEIDGLAATELELDASGASVRHLRCGYFFTNLLMDIDSIRGGVLATAMDLDRPMPLVAPADIAAVATARLLSRSWGGRHIQAVHGPEDLSFRQVAQQLTTVLDHVVEARQLRDEVRTELSGFGLSDAQIPAVVMMTAGIRDDFRPENPRTYATTTPTTLPGWASTHPT